MCVKFQNSGISSLVVSSLRQSSILYIMGNVRVFNAMFNFDKTETNSRVKTNSDITRRFFFYNNYRIDIHNNYRISMPQNQNQLNLSATATWQ